MVSVQNLTLLFMKGMLSEAESLMVIVLMCFYCWLIFILMATICHSGQLMKRRFWFVVDALSWTLDRWQKCDSIWLACGTTIVAVKQEN
eukprot:6456492-Amphidinium_carterae.2